MSRTTNKNSPINSKQPFLVEISPVAQGTAGLNHRWWGNRFHLWQGWAWRLSCQPGIIYSEQSWSKGTLEILVWENKFLHPRDMHRAQYLGQNRISRVRWLGIHSLHTGQKNKTKTKNPEVNLILSASYLLWWDKELQVCYESPGKRLITVA